MRIYGGHDYYDCGLSLGIDPLITLVRNKNKSVSVRDAGVSILDQELTFRPERWNNYTLHSVAVAFCTKVYRGAIITAGYENKFCFWSAEKIRAWSQGIKGLSVVVREPWHVRKRTPLEKYFKPREASAQLREYMIANKYSILVEEDHARGEESYLQINPIGLKQLGFAKALDPYTAFQELSMWIGGVLGGTSPEIVTIKDDKVLIEGHGFDNRISFRGPRIQ
jgi:hypothetical protein